ncbi:protein of unknown function [Modestobacter italicus]|uniref:Uncharacterized protein n=1 Tax=Modestobacter italicus (strain DSM 44449 / CECT 9708 / BC 501) TaxID=2732864 RepID=I4EYI1_MODI5|nr:protein of unknown function [Modestobacter marinus]
MLLAERPANRYAPAETEQVQVQVLSDRVGRSAGRQSGFGVLRFLSAPSRPRPPGPRPW